MSDTPRTDAFEQKVPYSRTDLLAFARQLERELNAAGPVTRVCGHYINGIHHTDRCYNCGHTLSDHQPVRLG